MNAMKMSLIEMVDREIEAEAARQAENRRQIPITFESNHERVGITHVFRPVRHKLNFSGNRVARSLPAD